jgi:hypothetical protein
LDDPVIGLSCQDQSNVDLHLSHVCNELIETLRKILDPWRESGARGICDIDWRILRVGGHWCVTGDVM